MRSLVEIPEIERKVIYIGKFENINYVAKNNTIKHTVKDYLLETSKKPITNKLPIIITGPIRFPNILDNLAGAIKTLSKKWAALDYIEVPHEIASTELLWKGTVKPELNKFYILSPRNNKVYYPFEKYHSLAFEEKVNEAIRIFMHLKPKELFVVHEEGYDFEVTSNAEVHAKSKLVKGNGHVHIENKSNKKFMFKASFQKPNLINRFKSMKLPDDLVWYPTEEKWRSIVEGVLNLRLSKVDMEINYTDDFGVDTELQANVLKQAKINIGTNVTQFKRTCWKVTATFWR